jgi:hypothetical protein
MISHYTIKFGPAVSQKELEKALRNPEAEKQLPDMRKLKVRVELICDFEELKKIKGMLSAAEKEEAH